MGVPAQIDVYAYVNGDALFWHDNVIMSCGAWSFMVEREGTTEIKAREVWTKGKHNFSNSPAHKALHSIKINATFREQGL
jgi:hypothetical protein